MRKQTLTVNSQSFLFAAFNKGTLKITAAVLKVLMEKRTMFLFTKEFLL